MNFAGISSAAAALYGAESVLEISLEMTRHFVESDDEELLIKRFFFHFLFFPDRSLYLMLFGEVVKHFGKSPSVGELWGSLGVGEQISPAVAPRGTTFPLFSMTHTSVHP